MEKVVSLFDRYANSCYEYAARLNVTNELILLFLSNPHLVNTSIKHFGYPMFKIIGIINVWQWRKEGLSHVDRCEHLVLMYEVFEVMLECGANVNIRSKNDITMLSYAQDPYIVKRLIECGADVYALVDGWNVVYLRALDLGVNAIVAISKLPLDHQRLIAPPQGSKVNAATYYTDMCKFKGKTPNPRIVQYLTTGEYKD